ncbi:MAG: response regulator [Deltaproteobacteria bacterium]|nr:response regulator [Deltaproteobacteria bacterium]
MRILVVDDDASVREMLATWLNVGGHETIAVETGESALSIARDEMPDLVIVDQSLPGMNGLELTRHIKAMAGEDFLPIVMLTGRDNLKERMLAYDAGCDDLLDKPVSVGELRARVGAHLVRRRQHSELRRANEKLRDAQRLKEDLAALLVHDLRNPLSTLRGNLELLDGELSTALPLVRDVLTDCRELADRALGMVGGLLDVAQLEEGLLHAEPVEVVLAVFLPSCARYRRLDLEARRLRLDIRVVPEDLRAVFDPDLLGRLVENLIDNALRYAPTSGCVCMSAERQGDDLVVSVGNNGPPIPVEERERIFGKWYRIEARRAGARANRGLGLYFCKLAAEAHGGRIDVEETPEFPTLFVLRIPQPRGQVPNS